MLQFYIAYLYKILETHRDSLLGSVKEMSPSKYPFLHANGGFRAEFGVHNGI